MKHLWAELHTSLGLSIFSGLVAAGAVGGGIYLYLQLEQTNTALTGLQQEVVASQQKMLELSDSLYAAQLGISAIQQRVGGFEETVGTITGTVGELEKLSKTDPELLQKYSKVFFLNEHYAPERLVAVDEKYVYDEDETERVHALVWPHLEDLLEEAHDDGVELYIKSSFRSFNEQSALKSAYSVTYGSGTANQFSADQGYSEHQLGTTVDFITTGLGGQLSGFEKTEAYDWLLRNAHRWGFVLSYPEGNSYYVFEPWHWRYVGESLAGYLHSQDKNFYDLEQREIDQYLVDIFD